MLTGDLRSCWMAASCWFLSFATSASGKVGVRITSANSAREASRLRFRADRLTLLLSRLDPAVRLAPRSPSALLSWSASCLGVPAVSALRVSLAVPGLASWSAA